MSKVYINYRDRSTGLRETVDEFDSAEFQSSKEFRAYVREQLAYYASSHWNGEIYRSRRCCANWKD
jgi:hypothetical protein